MIRKKRWKLIGLYSALLLLVVSQIGCAMGEFGKANVDAFNINVPSGLIGQNKSAITRILGNPSYVLTEGGTEYWGYRNHNGWYLWVYVSFGMTEAKDLILEFQGDQVKTTYLIDKGSSIGILTAPLAVAN